MLRERGEAYSHQRGAGLSLYSPDQGVTTRLRSHTGGGGGCRKHTQLTSTTALGCTVTAVSGALMKDQWIWMSSLFSFMWSSSYQNTKLLESYTF